MTKEREDSSSRSANPLLRTKLLLHSSNSLHPLSLTSHKPSVLLRLHQLGTFNKPKKKVVPISPKHPWLFQVIETTQCAPKLRKVAAQEPFPSDRLGLISIHPTGLLCPFPHTCFHAAVVASSSTAPPPFE